MATVTLATIRTNSYTVLYDHLQTGTYAITTNNIFSSFNNEQILKNGYPQVIINKPTILASRLTVDPSAPIYRCRISIVIDVYEDDAAGAKTVADEIMDKIITGQVVLRTNKLQNIEIVGEESDTQEYTQEKSLHLYKITLEATFISN